LAIIFLAENIESNTCEGAHISKTMTTHDYKRRSEGSCNCYKRRSEGSCNCHTTTRL